MKLNSVILQNAQAETGLNPKKILKSVDASRFPDGDINFTASIQETSNELTIATTKYKVSSRDGADSLIETISPAKRSGRKYLFENDNLWFYSPDIKKPTRLNLQQRLTGEVANGDLARTKFYVDYDAEIVKTEIIDKKNYYHLKLKAKNKTATYSNAELWVSSEKLTPFKVIYFANSGKPLKEGQFMDFKSDGSFDRPMTLKILSLVNKKNVSFIFFSNIKRVQFEKNYFNKDRLLRL